jgi:uncharacterized protein YmfQ (DUF2313 family)
MADRHVRRGGADYKWALSELLPPGIGWPRDEDSVLMRVVGGLTSIWGFVDGRIADWIEREADPRTTVEMLRDWETAFGLPDACLSEPLSVADRQRVLVQRMTIEGGQSRQFFIDLAAEIGYEIDIKEYRPFMVGIDRAGDNRKYIAPGVLGDWPAQIGDPDMRFVWTVNVHHARLTWFRAGSGQAGVDPHLRIGIASDLECIIRRWKPAHTVVVFSYVELTQPADPMAGTP